MTHYFSEGKHSWYSKVGIGHSYVGSRYSDVGGDGVGFILGIGFELFKQVELGADFIHGRGSESGSHSATATMLSLVATVIAY